MSKNICFMILINFSFLYVIRIYDVYDMIIRYNRRIFLLNVYFTFIRIYVLYHHVDNTDRQIGQRTIKCFFE